MRRTSLTLLVLIGCFHASVVLGANHDESVDGDLSGDRLAPTSIDLDLGSNVITATSVAGDREYYVVTVENGTRLAAVVLVSYVSPDPISFIAVQNGTTFTQPPTGTDVSQLLGWTHFGPGHVGTTILDDIGTGAGAMGFVPPLGPGDYTFWSQQTGPNATTYALDFQVVAGSQVPALSGVGLALLSCAALALIALVLWRRHAVPREGAS
jgi:hypothetical protein